MNICKECKLEFDPHLLPPSRQKKGEIRYCSPCWRRRTRAGIKRVQDRDPTWILHSSAKARSRKRGLEFSIERSDCTVPKYCPVLGIPLIPQTKIHSDNSPTLDRIDNDKGYTKDNIWVISMRANKIKSVATLSELEALVKALKKIKGL